MSDGAVQGQAQRPPLVADRVEEAVARAAATEATFHTFIELFPEQARTAARQIDAAVAGGAHLPGAGIVLGVKDTIRVREAANGAGGTVALTPPGLDAAIVAQLRASGAVVVGRQVCHLFGIGLDFPPARNAWDPDRYPGGSTAGGGASVALGSCSAAIGSDAAGSIRKPASVNGMVGLRPTPGSVAQGGSLPGPPIRYDQTGWITPTVAASRRIAQLLGVPGTTTPARPEGQGGLEDLRIGLLAGTLGPTVDPGVRQVLSAAWELIADAGARTEEIPVVDHDDSNAAFGVLLGGAGAAAHQATRRTKADAYPPWVLELFDRAVPPGSPTAINAEETVARARKALEGATRAHDVLIAPTLEIPPLRNDEMAGDDGMVRPSILDRYCRWTILASLAELPAITIPAGLDHRSLPVGIQLIGRPGHDGDLLDVAERLAAIFPTLPTPPALAHLPG